MQEFEQVVDRCQRSLYTYAVYYLGQSGEAEEVAQEAFMRLWNHRDKVRFDTAEAWLHRVTRNLCFDRLRRRKVARVVVNDNAEAKDVADVAPDPEQEVRASDFRRRLNAALLDLSEPMKSVLILREIQGLKYREIADMLDIPLNSVRVYVHRGRKKLRHKLTEGVVLEHQI